MRIGTTRKCKIEKDGEVIIFNSIVEAAKFLNVRPSTIRSSEIYRCKCKGYYVKRLEVTSHCQSKTPLYKTWVGMKDRCYREGHKYFAHYGGKGITVCDEWLHDYMAFKAWAEDHGYKKGLTIDRIDNNKGYSPENCKWSTQKEQLNNRSINRILEYKGEKYTMAQLADKSGIKHSTFRERLNRGWTIEKAVEAPVR